MWFNSCIANFNKKFNVQAVLDSYVDNGFGGDISYATAYSLIQYIT